MSRRGGGNRSDNRRNQPQPSPATSHQSPSTSQPQPINTAATIAGSSSAPTLPSPATVSTEALTTELQQKLSLQSASAPSSQKAIRFPNRPGYGQLGRKVQVRANHFQLQVAERDLHHYDVSISPEITSKKVSRDIINQLVKTHRESLLENRIPAYDGRKSLFTAGPLPFTSKVFVVNLADEDRGSSSSGSDRKKREREFKVTIKFASKTDIVHLTQFLRRLQPDCPYETIQILDVALRATPAEMYTAAGRSFFSPNLGAPGPLGGGTQYWRGFYQSIRPAQMGLSLNIDVSSRAFYEPVLVTEFVSKHFPKLNFTRQLSDQDRLKIKKALKGLKLRLSHGAGIRSCKVTGLSKEPLKDLTFTLDDKVTRTRVLDYFRENYNIQLKYPLLPALQSGTDAKPTYFPMELCQIEPGQRYSKRLNEEQVTNLLRATCQRPPQREQDIRNIVKQHRFNSDKVVREFGINVREELALVDARVLPPPTLKYHGTGGESKLNPQMGAWNMISKKMVDGGKLQFWSCLCFSKMDPTQFCRELINMCQAKGLVCNPEPAVPMSPANPHHIERELENFNKQCRTILDRTKQKLQLLIIILPDLKFVRTYDRIKRVCETELGIVTQCCQPRQAQKMQKQYFENLALKINVKVGGRNTVLNDAFERRIPLVTDRPTIIFGADVTHPQPGEDSSPSIAAVVASMDWPWVTKYRGVFSAQSHREEIIQDLYKTVVHPQRGILHTGMIRELIMAFYKSTGGRKPERIIFYRDGVSEGQFNQVLLYEMDAIRKACASIENGYLPPVTFVVVQKRHHTRLFPAKQGEHDRSGNIMPGTVVDTSICHPREFDFYLNSHAGIQGTSRPAHYHVLFDENKFTADQLQSLTNNLCYTYARCTRSVSIVPPAYYAHLLAFRARYYLGDAVDTSDSGSASGTRNAPNVVAALPSIIESVKDNMFYV